MAEWNDQMSVTAWANLLVVATVCTTVIGTSLLGGCTYPTDLKLVGLREVNGLPERRVLSRAREGLYTQTNESQPVLEVSVSSKTDLLQYARDTIDISTEAEFCDSNYKLPDIVGSPAPDIAAPFYVISDGENLPDLLSDVMFKKITELPRLSPGPDGRIIYHIYLLALGTSYHPEQRWNLADMPHDVCFHTHVDAYPPHRSNTVRIPAELISAALR